ncbi:glucose-methanol-choline oxidoreductase-like protein [Bimuria novae-zelandiae CBS 107.79]|uniref:Glucose-methanol-choline oxidoreductase-like protein n=1 Tax=Bimuria novae-zelandiae CBS 107.79 TaxID=1447943 RepID=A0A6A5UVJ2_9PLEO|nr:glucose-methanol-choline oxidoreductase-like protein [Bimuria novae-zelandiae CBS 107.79]
MLTKLQLTACALTLLLTTSRAWPAYHFTKRQSSDTPPAQSEDPSFEEEYDFIIAGGGTAGLTLANRLTESGQFSVLCLEAGFNTEVVEAYATPGGNQFLKGSAVDWGFLTTPQEHLGDRTLQYLRGRALGGSSVTNGLYYARGSSQVYKRWVELGNPGWGWKDTNPPNTPELSAISSAYGGGPLELGFQGYVTDSTNGFVVACSEAADIPIVEDLNLGVGQGVKLGTATVNSVLRRSSSYDSFYQQARNLTNLRVLFNAPSSGNGTASTLPRAIGVSYIQHSTGFVRQARARKEVIVSMGAFHTPQLLMVSGIGPASELQKVGVQPVHINENVGQHLDDHSVFSTKAHANPDSSTTRMSSTPDNLQAAQAEFYSNFSGPYTAPSGITNGFKKLSVEELESIGAGAGAVIEAGLANQSHIEFLFETVWYSWIPNSYYTPLPNESYISVTASSMVQLSRGNITLRTNSMSDASLINSNYYDDETDGIMGIHSFRYLRDILRHPSLAQYTIGDNAGEVSPGPEVADGGEAILQYIKNNTIPNWYASGTARMRPEADGGVVDPRLKVYGVGRLRAIDCSIILVLPDVNILAAVYMIAEKDAEMIKEDWGDLVYEHKKKRSV